MKKVVLVTGVSTGFGKQTAKLLAEAGHVVYGTIRSEAEADKNVNIIKLDITDVDALNRAIDNIVKKEGRIDVLINNAGMHIGGPIETTPEEYIKLQMDTNFLGMVRLSKLVLPHMRKAGSGLIINFSSIGGLIGLPFQGYYSACKFAIEGFSEAFRMEVKQFKIKVVVINPGDFRTNNSANRRKYLARTDANDPYYQQYVNTLEKIEKDEAKGWEPEILAKKMVKIVESKSPRQRYIIGSFEQRLSVLLKRILPGSIFRAIIQDYYKIK
jgi:short-subunit dehydrogenase